MFYVVKVNLFVVRLFVLIESHIKHILMIINIMSCVRLLSDSLSTEKESTAAESEVYNN